MAARGLEGALAEPGAEPVAVGERVERLDELVAGAVLSESRPTAERRARHGMARPRVQPDRYALANVSDDRVDGGRAGEKEGDADGDVQRPAGRHVEHREEDPEVEKSGAEVVRLHENEHRAAPDQKERPEVLQPALREHLALLAQVA